MQMASPPDLTSLPRKFQEEWPSVEEGFRRMLNCLRDSTNVPPQDKMDIYSAVFALGQVAGGSQTLYDLARQMVGRYLADESTERIEHLEGDQLLMACYKAWNRHEVVVKWVSLVFGYLDVVFTGKTVGPVSIDTVRSMTLRCFHTALYDRVKEKLRDVLLRQVRRDRDREGAEIEKDVVQNCVRMFVDMGLDDMSVYEVEMQQPYIAVTEDYYREKSAGWLAETSGVINFTKRAEDSILEEQRRARDLLHPTSEDSVMEAVEREILSRHQDRVLNDENAGLQALLMQWKEVDLARMFRVYSRVSLGVAAMSVILREHVKTEGRDLNRKLADGTVDSRGYVEECLALYRRYIKLFRTSMDNCEAMQRALREAFEVFLNDKMQQLKRKPLPSGKRDDSEKKDQEVKVPITSAELFSLYFDLLLGEKKTEDIEQQLEDCTSLFMFIASKDLFQEYYRSQLSKRLLQDKSSEDDERMAISKFKLKMGSPFTSKMEGMLNDKNVNIELQKKFKEWATKNSVKHEVEAFTVQVLTTGHWPTFKNENLTLPNVFATPIEAFKTFYHAEASSKVLQWVHNLGTATVAGRFKKGVKDLMVTTYQACVLLMFNEHEQRSLAAIVGDMGLEEAEVRATVASLSLGKLQILKKRTPGKKIEQNDEFEFNDDFTDPRRKFKVPVAIITTATTPTEKTDESRRHVTDACIVRIMKTRKQMAHGELQAECLRQLNATFRPDPKLIKKRIEDLIQRMYLERDAEDRNMYRYLA